MQAVVLAGSEMWVWVAGGVFNERKCGVGRLAGVLSSGGRAPARAGRARDPRGAHCAQRPQARELPGGGGPPEADRLWHRQGHLVGHDVDRARVAGAPRPDAQQGAANAGLQRPPCIDSGCLLCDETASRSHARGSQPWRAGRDRAPLCALQHVRHRSCPCCELARRMHSRIDAAGPAWAPRECCARPRARPQVGTLNYMSPEAILGGATNIRGGPPMKVGPRG
jgi:hypothetical protein